MSGFREARVGVVLAQVQAVFRARGEHAVRLQRAVRDEVVDQHADVRLVATRRPWRLAAHRARGIQARDEALRGGLLVAGRAVDLAREEQPAHALRLERGVEPARIEVVVFDRVARARHVCALEAGDGAHERHLHVERQRSGNAVRVDLVRVQAFRLEEHLVRALLGEAHHLVLDRRAVARADAFDLSRVERRAVERGSDQLVRVGPRVRDPARHLRRMLVARAEVGEHRARVVAGLLVEAREFDRAAVEARRRAGLQAVDAERQLAQPGGEPRRGRIARATARMVREADVDQAGEERAGREHDGARAQFEPELRDDAGHALAVQQQVVHALLQHRQVRLVLDDRPDRRLVALAVGLAARRAHGRALRRVQRAPVDAGAVGRARHRAAERVDLLHEVALADAADRRVAAHLADRLDVVREQQRARARAGRGERGFGAGVAATDHDHIMERREVHRCCLRSGGGPGGGL